MLPNCQPRRVPRDKFHIDQVAAIQGRDVAQEAVDALILAFVRNAISVVENHQCFIGQLGQHDLEFLFDVVVKVGGVEKGDADPADAFQRFGQVFPAVAEVQFHSVGHAGGLQVGIGSRGIIGVEFEGEHSAPAAGVDERLGKHDGGAAPVGTGFDDDFFAVAVKVGKQQVVDEPPAGVADGCAAFLAGLFDGGDTVFKHGELRVRQQAEVVAEHAVVDGGLHSDTH